MPLLTQKTLWTTYMMDLEFHVTWELTRINVSRNVYIDIRRDSSIRQLLPIYATKTPPSAFVLPKLDHCKSLFYGCTMYMLERHQKVQNTVARLIFQYLKQNHISPLYCQPIKARIEFKILSYLSIFLLRFSTYLLVWFTLSVHTQRKHTLFFWQWKYMYPYIAKKEIWASLIFLCNTHNMEVLAFRTQTYWIY